MLIILTRSTWMRETSSIFAIAKKAAEIGEKMAVLHVQDACTAATIEDYCNRLTRHKIEVYALKPDCEARGLIGKVSGSVRLIDYKQWVKLVMTKHNKIISWTT